MDKPETLFDKPISHIHHGHDSHADALVIHFSDGTQLAIVLRPPARLKDARMMYFGKGGERALILEDLFSAPRPN